MLKEKNIIVSILIVGVVILLAFLTLRSSRDVKPNVSGEQGSEKYTSLTMTETPDVAVPDVDSTNLPENVAKPESVTPTITGSNTSIRVFSLEIKNNKFFPDTFIVESGDSVRLNVTAVDKNYDLVQPDYGINYNLTKGKTQLIGLQVTVSGKFTLYCASCGGPDKGPVGYLIVK